MGFLKCGYPNSGMVYLMDNPKITWMMTGGTPYWWKPPFLGTRNCMDVDAVEIRDPESESLEASNMGISSSVRFSRMQDLHAKILGYAIVTHPDF